MIQGTKDLLSSERGTLVLLLVIAATVLVIIGKLDVETWIAYTKWVAVSLVASKTITSAVETISAEQTNRAIGVPVAKVVATQETGTSPPDAASNTPS